MIRRVLFLLSVIPIALIAKGIPYNVEFEGLDDSKALKSIKLASNLTSLKKRPPASINALRYRADSDIPELIKVLHAHGYYEANVNIQIHEAYKTVQVVVLIEPGPRYKLESYQIHLYCQESDTPHRAQEGLVNLDSARQSQIEASRSDRRSPAPSGQGEEKDRFGKVAASPNSPNLTERGINTCCYVSLDDIDIELNRPAIAEGLLNSEQKLMQRLAECGYPLAKIENRDCIVDGNTKTVRIKLDVKMGEKATFGPTSIAGTKRVKPLYIEQKLDWKEGQAYDSREVEKTQKTLIDSGLFSSVLITHEESLDSNGELPLKIEVHETRHRKINLGVSYQTVFGPGLTFGWANYNVGGMGRTLSFQGDITHISQTGVAYYLHPNFNRVGQDMIAQAEAAHESLSKAYSMRSYNILDRFERLISKKLRIGIGVKGERLFVTDSAQNGNFWLLEVPFYLRWSTANSLLNPTRGMTLEYTATPAIDVAVPKDIYFTQQFTGAFYQPLDEKERVVLAEKLTYGFILSNGLAAIPLCKRFLGGSEEDLRGYRYQTVSPLEHGKPIGGRSAIFLTIETRFRLTESIGLVPFIDLGSVYRTALPTIHEKWYKSAGLGLRFFTSMGPFRLDIAFPLDRRNEFDPAYKILVSIGQMF